MELDGPEPYEIAQQEARSMFGRELDQLESYFGIDPDWLFLGLVEIDLAMMAKRVNRFHYPPRVLVAAVAAEHTIMPWDEDIDLAPYVEWVRSGSERSDALPATAVEELIWYLVCELARVRQLKPRRVRPYLCLTIK